MNSFNYLKLRATVSRLIDRFGDDCVIVHYVDTPDPSGYKPPVRTRVDTPVRGVFVKATEKHADGQLIHIGDQLILVSGAVDREKVNVQGSVIRGTETWKVEVVVPLKPGSVDMLYKIKVSQ